MATLIVYANGESQEPTEYALAYNDNRYVISSTQYTPTLRFRISILKYPYVTGDQPIATLAVSYTHLRAHETRHDLVCRLLLENSAAYRYIPVNCRINVFFQDCHEVFKMTVAILEKCLMEIGRASCRERV